MTATRDPDPIVRAWLDLMPDEAPDRAIESVLQAVETTPQRRPRLGGPWRLTKMTRLAIVAAAAAILVATGTLLLLRPAANVGPTPSSSPVSAPSPSGTAGPLDDVLRATWLAFANSSEVLAPAPAPSPSG